MLLQVLSRASMSGHSGLKRMDSGLVRMSSCQSLDSSFDEVPGAEDFQFRINDPEGNAKEYAFTLKQGKTLPYHVKFEGKLDPPQKKEKEKRP